MKKNVYSIVLLFIALFNVDAQAQQNVARQWNEAQIAAIRRNFAKPTVHARNLFHASIAMYDAWAAYDHVAKPFLLGDTVGNFICPFTGVTIPTDSAALQAAREEAISYAAFRLLSYRYLNRPATDTITKHSFPNLFIALGYDSSYHGVDYANGTPADLGNYIAQQLIAFGLQDGSNEQNNYSNQYYTPTNPPLSPWLDQSPSIVDPNRWQPLTLDTFVDQNGVVFPGINTPAALTPEWGNVTPFSLTTAQKTVYSRGGHDYNVYMDPGPAPKLDSVPGFANDYKWTHTLTAVWSSHLDPSDSVKWDISPAHIGNAHDYPTTPADYPNFYNLTGGGDNGTGYTINPKTGQPYAPQIVPRGDYARVLAEFWADGPTSETPPGHWFTILNYVHDHPAFVRRWNGKGPIMDDLEWTVKSYFSMGGAVHDAAICAWGDKGWYDSARPITAIRYMASQGQSSDSTLSNYSPLGIPLVPGYIEVVDSLDPLAGAAYENVGKIKLKAWRGPLYIGNPATSVAGVTWILAGKWWPYQRKSFVTPPFPGYISGHSTYSRTAAEVMTLITGDEYFPGGMGEFHAPQNQYLVFEDGPSVDVTLQWAKYSDASDQCSLSRIWGGIHPPADDIPGRLIGMQLGPEAFNHAKDYFYSVNPSVVSFTPSTPVISDATVGASAFSLTVTFDQNMDTSVAPVINFPLDNPLANTLTLNTANSGWQDWTSYTFTYNVADSNENLIEIDVQVSGAQGVGGNTMEQFITDDPFFIDTKNPIAISVTPSVVTINGTNLGTASFTLTVTYNEDMDNSAAPVISFPNEDPSNTLTFNVDSSGWLDFRNYEAKYDVVDADEVVNDIDVAVISGIDLAGNEQLQSSETDNFSINTVSPTVVSVTANPLTVSQAQFGVATVALTVAFDKDMDTTVSPVLSFPVEDAFTSLNYDSSASYWLDNSTYVSKYDVTYALVTLHDIDVRVTGAVDQAGNEQPLFDAADIFNIDTKNPEVVSVTPSTSLLTDADVGIATFTLAVVFDEDMDTTVKFSVAFPNENPLTTLSYNAAVSEWLNTTTYEAKYDVTNSAHQVLSDIDVEVATPCTDLVGNVQASFDESDKFSIDMSTGISSIAVNSSIRAYPNPVGREGNLIIELNNLNSNSVLQLFNTQGKMVLSENVNRLSEQQTVQVNTASLPSGLYLLRVSGNGTDAALRVQVLGN